MYCQNCGFQMEENSKFCSKCGKHVISGEKQPNMQGEIKRPEKEVKYKRTIGKSIVIKA